jgi:hypothetical protein
LGTDVKCCINKHEDREFSLYGVIVTPYLYVYSPDVMNIDAKAAAARLLAMVENEEKENEPT